MNKGGPIIVIEDDIDDQEILSEVFKELKYPNPILFFDNNQGIKDNIVYPQLDQFKKDWDRITPELRNAFMHVTDQKLDSEFDMMPEMKMKIYDLVTFITYREANCIGQIALWRRLLGYEPMKYM